MDGSSINHLIDPRLLAEAGDFGPSASGSHTSSPEKRKGPSSRSGASRKKKKKTSSGGISGHLSQSESESSGSSNTSDAEGDDAAPRIDRYTKMRHADLKQLCKTHGLRVTGTVAVLTSRLRENDKNTSRSRAPPIPAPSTLIPASLLELDPADAISAAKDLEAAFINASAGCDGPPAQAEQDDEDDEEGDDALGEEEVVFDPEKRPDVAELSAWVDAFILASRRPQAQQTEKSVLKQYKRWALSALIRGEIPDRIVDANHIIAYMGFTGTRLAYKNCKQVQRIASTPVAQFTRHTLSAASIKKHYYMLGRVRNQQVSDNPSLDQTRPAFTPRVKDFNTALMIQAQRKKFQHDEFDITKNTVLDSQLYPEHFDQITRAIFTSITHTPRMLKAFFSWNVQCSTLHRGDEILNLSFSSLHPFKIFLNDFVSPTGHRGGPGRWVDMVLLMHHDTKTAKPDNPEPDYNAFLPHRDPLRCPIGALALLLHYIFDEEQLHGKASDWDWSKPTTWHYRKLIWGRTVLEPCKGDTLRKVYETFLGATTISSQRKLHLARKTIPGVLEDMGVPSDQITRVGHWSSNTLGETYASKIPRAAVTAMAGFWVGEQYHVPHTTVPVSSKLQQSIFPFAEDAKHNLTGSAAQNRGVLNFFELLQFLRPFFWRTLAAIHAAFCRPGQLHPLFRHLKILEGNQEAFEFFAQWPTECQRVEAEFQHSLISTATSTDMAMAGVFMSFSAQLNKQGSLVEQLINRTAQWSPSKKNAHICTCASCPTHSAMIQSTGNSHFTPDPAPPTPSPDPIYSTPSRTAPSTSQIPALLSGPSNIPSTSSSLARLPPVVANKPQQVSVNSSTYWVLRITDAAPSPFDFILPKPEAFIDPVTALTVEFPTFTPLQLTWANLFTQIRQPREIWYAWKPKDLGQYSSVASLWADWSEDRLVEGAGKMPALRLIDERWGTQHDREKQNRGSNQTWRPQEVLARKQWSNYWFFVERIKKAQDSGVSAANTVMELDDLRAAEKLSLPGLRKKLALKKQVKSV